MDTINLVDTDQCRIFHWKSHLNEITVQLVNDEQAHSSRLSSETGRSRTPLLF